VAIVGALLAGLLLLALGADLLVRGGTALARRLGVAPLVIGLTVVAFGTSAPECVVSVRAALADRGAIAIGNVIGSNIVNVLLILALAVLVRPLRIQAKVIRLDIPIMIAVSIAAAPVLLAGRIGRVAGLVLLAGIVAYTWLSFLLARRERDAAVDAEYETGMRVWPRSVGLGLLSAAGGVATLAAGAESFVGGAVKAAAVLGVPEAVIGLTVVAVGTSLPELVTAIVAAARTESDIAVGNLVGSNIFNLLAILGTSAVARPLRAEGILVADYVVMLAAALILFPLARSGQRLSRAEAVLLLLGYAGYTALRAGYQ
jgi:cation:H+ antiporter